MTVDLTRKESKEKTQSELAPTSMISCDTGNGDGSTNTKVRRFVNATTVGTSITRASSAAAGDSFTINKSGIYAISYTDRPNGTTNDFGISLNSSNLTTNVESLAVAERLMLTRSTDAQQNVSWTGRLSAGDVIRPHTDGFGTSDNDNNQFVITQISVL